MQFTLKRLLVAVTVCVLVFAVYAGFASVLFNRLIVTNNASQSIRAVDVSVWDQTVTVTKLKPGATAQRRFRSHNSDSGFHVVVTFSDGSTLQHTDGYVTGGSITGERCDIAVTDDRITIDQQY